MLLDRSAIAARLRAFDFSGVFTQELGWDFPPAGVSVLVGGQVFELQAAAEKRGMVAYVLAAAHGETLPDQTLRRRIEREVSKSVREHFIVFTDAERSVQIWQWVRREPGRPLACRETTWRVHASPEPIIQRLTAIAVDLDEEDTLTLVDVTVRAGRGFDLETVTKRFYERFKTEHTAFLPFLKGIPDDGLQRWYASVMLNRLMFLYFIQKKGFLARDEDYLPHRLAQSQAVGRNFYRGFLCPLFFDGLAKRREERPVGTSELLGEVPYLNGGIFQPHEVEQRYGQNIEIADEVFVRLFAFFREWNWHLDERPLRANNEINPDVLGYIFEKYINQKQMGAYYTKEDITEYISKNCITPFLLEALRGDYGRAFQGEQTVWNLLVEQPDRYIHDAVKLGLDQPLPNDIAAGVTDLGKRGEWNRTAAPGFGHPTETWREVIGRHQRYTVLRDKIAAGEVRDATAFVSLNLHIRQFAQDVIEYADADLLSAAYDRIHTVSILDPTCGSGAFLFAALLVLEPLYAACLERMAIFVEEWHHTAATGSPVAQPDLLTKFETILADAADRPSERYFILKNIVTRNLYGVDIMEEAVEICKLRLFLKLVAQVEPNFSEPNFGIEPLPDMDFNVVAGNTLVGYATRDEVRRAMQDYGDGQMRLGVEDELQSFANFGKRCEDLDAQFKNFREQQTAHGGAVPAADKQALRDRLSVLGNELNRYLAHDYGVRLEQPTEVANWLASHQPFHWFIGFHEIMERGGFDVIVGNPPYVVYSPSKIGYSLRGPLFKTFESKNLFAYVYERSLQLAGSVGHVGLIIQLTAMSSEKMASLQTLILQRGFMLAASFPRRPQSMFEGVEMPVCIIISSREGKGVYTSRIDRFYTEERPTALQIISFQTHAERRNNHRIGKLSTSTELEILAKLAKHQATLESLLVKRSGHKMYYQEACRYWVKAMNGSPFFMRNGAAMEPPHGRFLYFKDARASAFSTCLLNSSFFYWFYSAFSDCEHINDSLLRALPIPNAWAEHNWTNMVERLMTSMAAGAIRKQITTKQGHKIAYDEISASGSKSIINTIDGALAASYCFTDTELDLIINYDIKYRMGRDVDVQLEVIE